MAKAKVKTANYASIYKEKAIQWKEYALSLEKLVEECLGDLKDISQGRVVIDCNRGMNTLNQFTEFAADRLKRKINFRSTRPKHDYRKGV